MSQTPYLFLNMSPETYFRRPFDDTIGDVVISSDCGHAVKIRT